MISSLTRISTINYNVALNLINWQQFSQNYFLTAIAAKIAKLGLHCSLLWKASLSLKSCIQGKLTTMEHFGSTLVQLNRNLSGTDFRFNWTEVDPEKFHSTTIWLECMISSLPRISTINYNVPLILINSQQFSVQLGSIEPQFICHWFSVQLNRSWTR